ncbi:sn-glycerol-1-phosphate dehydrogenase [Blautia sp. CLA-JM-H16]|uniref:Sn-glycerol-1-phosphate dehydrogenase n=1 Tax=Blautia aquisgranensis TaxID=3133153 RepID=A0ABV1BE05_9FIRM
MRVDADDFARPCGCGREHHIDVKEIIIRSGAVEKLEEEMSDGELKEYISPLLICDTNSYKATEELMEDIYDRCQVLILDAENLEADERAVEIVENYMEEDIDLVLAVGAGTIHDLSRYVAHQYRIPFVSVPTAASSDGFTSTVADMTWNGVKKMVKASAPIFVFADTDIFAKAPGRLAAAGVSDILGKYIALADWKIGSILTEEYYCAEVVKLETRAIRTVKDNLKEIAAGEEDACEKLMYALVLSGLAMQMTGNSRPASGAEHHLVHLWDMEVLNGHLNALHGEKVSAGTMLTLLEYKKIADAIHRKSCKVHTHTEKDRDLLQKTFGKKGVLDAIYKENAPEILDEISTRQLSDALPEIAQIIDSLPSVTDMQEMMSTAGCVSRVRDIGLPRETISDSLRLAPYTRRRLSLLRLSKMLTY